MIQTQTNPRKSTKSVSSTFYLFLGVALLISACSSQEPTVFASFSPVSPLYELIEIQINRSARAGETGNGEISLEFTSNTGQVLSFTLTAQAGELFLAQALAGTGRNDGDLVDAEVLRGILVDSDVVSAGQFKISDAERTIDLVVRLTDPVLTGALRPEGFTLVDTNLNILE